MTMRTLSEAPAFLRAIFVISLLLSSSSTHAAPRDHRFTSWTVGEDPTACQRHLENLAGRFSAAVQAPIVDRKCGEPVMVQDRAGQRAFRPLYLIYRAETPLNFSRATLGRDSSDQAPGTYGGAFASLETCLAARKPIGEVFERETARPLIDTYCELGGAQIGIHRGKYVLQVVAAPPLPGRVKTLQLTGFRLHSFANEVPAALTADLERRLRAQGHVIAHQDEGFIWSFAEHPAAVKIWPISGLDLDGACEAQKQSFIESLKRLGSESVPSFYCLKRTPTPQALQMGLALWSSRRSVDLSLTSLEAYTSLKDCLEDRPRLEAGLLDRNEDPFRVTIGVACVSAIGSLDPRNRYEARSIEAWR